jgi:hypothetical protein
MVCCDEHCVVEIASPAFGGFAMTDKTAFGEFAMMGKIYFRGAMTKINITTGKLFFCHCEESRLPLFRETFIDERRSNPNVI